MAFWDPVNEIDALHREIEKAFDEFGLRSDPSLRAAFLPGRAARRYPLVNLREDKDVVYVEALAPGVDPKSFNLSVVGKTLTISGEKQRTHNGVKPEAFHRSERASGRFVRMIELPIEVDQEKVGADYRNGLLVVSLPKADSAKPKQINVRVS